MPVTEQGEGWFSGTNPPQGSNTNSGPSGNKNDKSANVKARIQAKRQAKIAARARRREARREYKANRGGYTVGTGDSYAKLAGELLGDQRYAEELINANRDPYGRIVGLQPGMVLRIPKVNKRQLGYFNQATFNAVTQSSQGQASQGQGAAQDTYFPTQQNNAIPTYAQPYVNPPTPAATPTPTAIPTYAQPYIPGGQPIVQAPSTPWTPPPGYGQPSTAPQPKPKAPAGTTPAATPYTPPAANPSLQPGQSAAPISTPGTNAPPTPLQRLLGYGAMAGTNLGGYLSSAWQNLVQGVPATYNYLTGQGTPAAVQRDRPYPSRYAGTQAPGRPDLQPGQRAPETYSTYAQRYMPGSNPNFFGPGSGGIITPANAQAAAINNYRSQALAYEQSRPGYKPVIQGAQVVTPTQQSGMYPGQGAYVEFGPGLGIANGDLRYSGRGRIGGGEGYPDLNMPGRPKAQLEIYGGYTPQGGSYYPSGGGYGGGGGYGYPGGGGGGPRPGGGRTFQRPPSPALGPAGYTRSYNPVPGAGGRPVNAPRIPFNGFNRGQRPVYKPMVFTGMSPRERAKAGVAFGLTTWRI